MSSIDKNQTTTHHQPFLSSLVIRPSVSEDAGGGGADGAFGGRVSDYEPGEVRRDPPPYTRSDRYHDEPGYTTRTDSGSPIRHRHVGHRYSPNFNHSGGLRRSREFDSGRDPGRYRDSSPPYGRGRGSGRPFARAFDGPGFGPGTFRGEAMSRNNPNVRQREGDWICPDPLCENLNFARREYCNNCKRFRYGPGGSPRRGHPGPPPSHAPPPRRFLDSPLEHSPGRSMNGYRPLPPPSPPPRAWAREGLREFATDGLPPPRHEARFSDHHMRRERLDYPENDYRGRNKFDRPMPMDWGHRDRGRNAFNERKGFERRPPSPPPPAAPFRRWAHDVRGRSRSPIRGSPPPKDYYRDMYMDQGRGERHAVGRDRIGDSY